MPRRFLIAPDKFKGSLTAREAAAAIAEGILRTEPDAVIDLCPIADGGEGFLETIHEGAGGEWISCQAVDARGRAIDSRYLLIGDGDGRSAVIAMSETAGIARLAADELHPPGATTRGVGMQIRHAVEVSRAARIVLGIGGSATNDAGCGMAAALGVRFLTISGGEIDPLPVNLPRVSRIETATRIPLPPVTVACDVDNPLLGPTGATAVFSRQKGATDEDQIVLEDALCHLVDLLDAAAAASIPGAGAAGGLGFGLMRFAGAEPVPGFPLVADTLRIPERIRAADIVITGEGSLDSQSLGGKGPVALARMAREAGKPAIAFCGCCDETIRAAGFFDDIRSLADTGLPREHLFTHAAPLLTSLAEAHHPSARPRA